MTQRALQIAAVHYAEDDDFGTKGPKEGPKVTGLDLPEVRSSKSLDLARGPGRPLEQFEVLEDAARIKLRKCFKIPLRARRIDEPPTFHDALRAVRAWRRG